MGLDSYGFDARDGEIRKANKEYWNLPNGLARWWLKGDVNQSFYPDQQYSLYMRKEYVTVGVQYKNEGLNVRCFQFNNE